MPKLRANVRLTTTMIVIITFVRL